MTNSVVTKLRLIALIAAVLLLLASVVVIGAVYALGQTVEILQARSLTASTAAQDMEIALYQIQWGLSRADGEQIVMDQRRQFEHAVTVAQDHAETDDEARLLPAITQQAKVVFDQLKSAQQSRGVDEGFDFQMRELHGRVAELISADQAATTQYGQAAQQQAKRVMIVAGLAMIAGPWTVFAMISQIGGALRARLRMARQSLERLQPRLSAVGLATDRDIAAIDSALAELGFPKPNPMLADE
jgi:hypothetical protein